MISSTISQASAVMLAAAGGILLFASDAVLPALVPGFPATAAWVGQLLAAAWLGVAALNWLQRRTRLGGIYGRPIVFTNLVLYFVGSLSLLRAIVGGAAPVLWAVCAPAAVMAITYGTLLFRGPFDAPPAGMARP